QAEDGIRDWSVTGVQTCALPISGEFTRRAVENGRLDLTQAEAVADLVAAETEAQRRQALSQFEGRLSALYEDWRARLIRAAAWEIGRGACRGRGEEAGGGGVGGG